MNVIAPPKKQMKVPEFLEWAEGRDGKYELQNGEILIMSPERAGHNVIKLDVALALRESARAAGVPCTVFTDGMTVVIDEKTAREPDAMLQLGPLRDRNTLTVDAPLIIVEVISPSSVRRDEDIKLVEYFSLPSVRHYLIVHAAKGAVVHHRKSESGDIGTRILREGDIDLSPPGMRLAVTSLLGPACDENDGSDGRERAQ